MHIPWLDDYIIKERIRTIAVIIQVAAVVGGIWFALDEFKLAVQSRQAAQMAATIKYANQLDALTDPDLEVCFSDKMKGKINVKYIFEALKPELSKKNRVFSAIRSCLATEQCSKDALVEFVCPVVHSTHFKYLWLSSALDTV